jgi:peroxiredoxin
LRSFERHLGEFDARGVRVVAISVDPPAINHEHCRKQGYTFTFLSDPRAEVIRRYGLLHEGAGPQGADIARPAEILIDATGTVRWVQLAESILARTRPDQVLRVIDELGLAKPPRG